MEKTLPPKSSKVLPKMYVSYITRIDDYLLPINNMLRVLFCMNCMYYVVSIFKINMDICLLNYDVNKCEYIN